MFRGMLLGMMMMVGGVYAVDSMADADTRPIVNWDVLVAKSVDAASFVRQNVARLIDRVENSQSAPVDRSALNAY
jgi:hypothetical protein